MRVCSVAAWSGPRAVPALAADPSPARFEGEIWAFQARDEIYGQPDDATLFVGSSSIRLWRTDAAFDALPTINRGFGGAQISDVLHYFDVIVRPYDPARIVIYAGENDIAVSRKTSEVVLTDFQRFRARVRALWPDVPVLFLSIKPSPARWGLWPRMRRANRLIRGAAADDPLTVYVDVAGALLDAEGQPRSDHYIADRLHLSQAGYRAWRAALSPHLR